MEFALSATQISVRDAVARICARFGDDYWLGRDRDGIFPL
jgi:acyl-CoA dehydrogenase